MAASTTATHTFKSFLMYKATAGASSYTKLIDIKEFPDLGGDPDMLETTTMSDSAKTYILGLQDMDTLKFTANYTKADFSTLNGLAGSTYDFAVWFGGTESGGTVTPDGEDGKFAWSGQLTAYVTGKGTNEVREITISISASTPIAFS